MSDHHLNLAKISGAVIVDRVLSELAGSADQVSPVIDDVHELALQDTFAHLSRLLINLPQNVHAILAARRDLPPRLHERTEGWAAGCGSPCSR